MRFVASVVVLGSVATMAAAVASTDFDHHHHHDDVPTDPRTECHSSCGNTIRISRTAKEGYCKDESWKKRFDDCLNCALKFEIWEHYGRGVGSAARKCGLDTTPKPVDGGASSKAELATAAASTTAIVTSAAPSQTSTSSVSTAVEQATSASSRPHDQAHHVPAPHASAATGAWMVTSAPTTAAGELNSTAPGAVIVTAGASKNILSGLAVAGLAALAAVGLF